MKSTATEANLKSVRVHLEEMNLSPELIEVNGHKAFILKIEGYLEKDNFRRLDGVKEILSVSKPQKKSSRRFKPEDSIIEVNDVHFGGGEPVIIAGPCSVESEEQIYEIAQGVKSHGAHMLRGGAFKPRTSPYSFQGLGLEGLKMLKAAGEKTGLGIVTEVLSTDHLDELLNTADMLQVGARNMQNFELLKALSRTKKPILLKRGMAASLEEFLLAAEYLLNGGNENVVLCERGVHSLGKSDRFVLDVNAIALIKEMSHLPIIADPSHAAGRYSLVPALGYSALAAGADGLILEVHHKPHEALSDGKQALTLETFEAFMKKHQA